MYNLIGHKDCKVKCMITEERMYQNRQTQTSVARRITAVTMKPQVIVKVSLRKLCSDQSLANIIRCSARTPRTIDAKKDLHGMPNECRLDVFKVTLKVECTNTEDNRRIERRLAWHA